MIFEYVDYRQFLKSALLDRQRKRPGYSMSAFAKQLGLTQPAISQVLAGKKNFSLAKAQSVAQKLQLSEREVDYFVLLAQLGSAKDPLLKDSILKKIKILSPHKKGLNEISVDQFKSIADWQHIAIRSILEIPDANLSVADIAQRLGIKRLEVVEALERLERLKLVASDPSDPSKYIKTKDYFVASSATANTAIRTFHRQMLEKAVQSLETQLPNEKFVGSETVSFAKEFLPEFEHIAEEFFQKTIELSKRKGRKTDVYHLGVQFFKLTKDMRGK